jgi:hypothetical protein
MELAVNVTEHHTVAVDPEKDGVDPDQRLRRLTHHCHL